MVSAETFQPQSSLLQAMLHGGVRKHTARAATACRGRAQHSGGWPAASLPVLSLELNGRNEH